jgi:hypothetical protein
MTESDDAKASVRNSLLKVWFKSETDRGSFLIILSATQYFFGIAITLISLKLLINERIAGDVQKPNSESAFVDTTNIMLHAFMSFSCGRYTSGLGDYVGRKVLLLCFPPGM